MSDQLKVALRRAAWIAVMTATLQLLTALQAEHAMRDAFLGAAISAVSILLTRGFGEGAYDTNRQHSNNVRPGDVGTTAPPTAPAPA